MDPIPKEEMGNATSMFNLMRNLGGSMGIATATTYLFRRQQFHTNLLGAHVNSLNPLATEMVRGIQAGLITRGADPVMAVRQSYGAVWGMVQQQAAMLSFVDTFATLAIVFLLVLPLLLLMKRPRYQGGPTALH